MLQRAAHPTWQCCTRPPTLRWPRAPPACRPQLLPLPCERRPDSDARADGRAPSRREAAMEAGAPKGRASDPALAHPPTVRWPRAPPACRPQLLPLPLPLCGDAACPVPVPNKKGRRDGLRVTCQLGRRWHATCVAWGTSTPEVHAVAVEQLGTGTVAEVQAQMEDEGLDEAMAGLEQGQHADAPAQRRRLRSQSCQSRTKKRQRIHRPRSRSWS